MAKKHHSHNESQKSLYPKGGDYGDDRGNLVGFVVMAVIVAVAIGLYVAFG